MQVIPEIKKRSCPFHGTKAKASAIPPKLTFPAGKCPLATRTIIRAPMDNGWGPVSPYLETFRSKPPSEAHSLTVSHPDSTIRDSLKSDVRQLLFFFTGFSCITLLVLYALRGGFVNSFLTETVDNYSVQLLSAITPPVFSGGRKRRSRRDRRLPIQPRRTGLRGFRRVSRPPESRGGFRGLRHSGASRRRPY